MQINFRDWSDLSADDRADAIYSAQMWLRGAFPLLLPCDISDKCKRKIVSEAQELEQRRDASEVAA